MTVGSSMQLYFKADKNYVCPLSCPSEKNNGPTVWHIPGCPSVPSYRKEAMTRSLCVALIRHHGLSPHSLSKATPKGRQESWGAQVISHPWGGKLSGGPLGGPAGGMGVATTLPALCLGPGGWNKSAFVSFQKPTRGRCPTL